jgi:copper chaperone CopZ
MSEVTYSVPEMHCSACEGSICRSLEKLAGISGTAVDLDGKRVTVAFDPGQTSADAIRAQIEKAGFDVG